MKKKTPLKAFDVPFKMKIGRKQREVEITVRIDDIEWDNDGIGAYEYWGAKCFDAGTDYVCGFLSPHIDIVLANRSIRLSGEKHAKMFGCLVDILHENEAFTDAIEKEASRQLEDEYAAQAAAMADDYFIEARLGGDR